MRFGTLNRPTGANEPVPLLGILANRVELQDVATRAQLAILAGHAQNAAERETLLALVGNNEASEVRYREQVFTPRKSVLDLLLRPRYYSICSSPLVMADACSITVACWTDRPATAAERSMAFVPTTWPRSTYLCAPRQGRCHRGADAGLVSHWHAAAAP